MKPIKMLNLHQKKYLNLVLSPVLTLNTLAFLEILLFKLFYCIEVLYSWNKVVQTQSLKIYI